jgi:DNA-binding transcriptional LysR family regulator
VSQIEEWAAEQKISLSSSNLMVDDISGCKEMVQSGIGWSILPRICLDDFNGAVQPLNFKNGSSFIRNSYALYHNSYFELKQVKLFISALIENEKQYD